MGFGEIRYPAHRPDMAIYVVSKEEDIAKLIPIFSTRMCISRVNARLNSLLNQNNPRASPTLETAYLSGLIDAEGCFWIKQEAKTNTFKFIFEISQKDRQLLIEIKSLFSFKPGSNNIYTDGSSWRLCFYSTKVREELIGYLAKYELRSHKNQVLKEWERGMQIKASNAPDKTTKLLEIKQKINMWRYENN